MKNINRIIDSELIASRVVAPLTTIPGGSGSSTSGGGLQNNDGTFTWVKYAPNGNPTADQMVDLATPETLWIGIAYNKTGRIESKNPTDYQWRLLTDIANMYWVDESGVKHFTWIKYAESIIAPYKLNDTAVGLKYMGIGLDKETAEPAPNALTEQQWFDALEWHQVLQGNPVVGANTYNWFKFAADIQGDDLSDYIGKRTFLGIAYGKDTPESSMTPSDYTFALITGLHVNPDDGTSTWIKFSKTPNQGIQDTPVGTVYFGYSFGNESATESGDYQDYTWKLVPQSTDNGGITMTSSLQTWLKFAPNETPTAEQMSDSPAGMGYIGIAINKVLPESQDPDSDDPSFYFWSQLTGDHGYVGADGRTYYIWDKYADDGAGLTNFSNEPGTRNFIGLSYANLTRESESPAESNNPANYLWAQIDSDIVRDEWVYMWVKFAMNDDGTVGFNDSPVAMLYMGLAYDKKTSVESDNPAMYVWNPIRGEQGYIGPDGKTYFTWVKYAYFIGAEKLYDDAGDRLYMGLSFSHLENEETNATTGDKSSELSATYTWYPIHTRALKDGLDGLDGNDGLDGQHGLDGIAGINGQHGPNGVDGTNGYVGRDGINGTNGSMFQNNIVTEVSIKIANLQGGEITEESIAKYMSDKGISVTEYENVIFTFDDSDPDKPDEPDPEPHLDLLIPLTLSVASKTASSVVFTWVNADPAIKRYKLHIFSSNGNSTHDVGDVLTFTVSPLNLGAYTAYLVGYDSYLDSKESNTVSFTLFSALIPDIQISQVTANGTFITYEIDNNFVADKFEVYRSTSGGAFSLIYTESGIPEEDWLTSLTTRGSYYRNTGLVPFTDYCYYAIAYQNNVASVPSETKCIKTLALVPEPSVAPTLNFMGSDMASLTFSVSYPASQVGLVEAYIIEYRVEDTLNASPWTPMDAVAPTKSVTISRLFSDTSYEVRLKLVLTGSTVHSNWGYLTASTINDEKAKVSLLFETMPTSQEVIDGYIGQLTIYDAAANSPVKVLVTADTRYLNSAVPGGIQFKNTLNYGGIDGLYIPGGGSETITVMTDNQGRFEDKFKLVDSEGSLNATTTVTALLKESYNGMDDVFKYAENTYKNFSLADPGLNQY